MDVKRAKSPEIISFEMSDEDLNFLSHQVAKMEVTAGLNIATPGAFTIRNHSFDTKKPNAFTIRNHNFSTDKPGAYTIRNYRFTAAK